ncbi:MAG: HlyD family secretion protein [Chitinophagales bacterium]|jgi:multidrug resistance efflux pump|nr:HlyD family secretion protein [Chitinophagales bacterium]
MEVKDINLKSDEVNEIFSKMPSNMVRWGNTWILVILVGLLVLASYVKYPDTLTGVALIRSGVAPVTLVSQQVGRLNLLKRNYSEVQKDEVFAVIESDASYLEMDSFYHFLKHYEIDSISGSAIPEFHIGAIQNDWSRFLIDLQDYRTYSSLRPEAAGIASGQSQIAQNQKSISNINEQLRIKQEQYQLAMKTKTKNEGLYRKGLISELDYQNAINQCSELKLTIKNLESQRISIQKSNTDYQKQIADYRIGNTQNESQKLTNLRQQRISLIEKIELWQRMNVFRSPMVGRLEYQIPLSQGMFVGQGMELFSIAPKIKSEVSAQVMIPMTGIGKIAVGQRAIIRLMHYPEEEFGVLDGKVKNISYTPNKEKMYLAEVSLPKGMKTSYDQEIEYQPNMEGIADIITKDKSFLNRIFEQFLKLMKKNNEMPEAKSDKNKSK